MNSDRATIGDLDMFTFVNSGPSFLSVIVHPSWVSQAPRVLSYCADALCLDHE